MAGTGNYPKKKCYSLFLCRRNAAPQIPMAERMLATPNGDLVVIGVGSTGANAVGYGVGLGASVPDTSILLRAGHVDR